MGRSAIVFAAMLVTASGLSGQDGSAEYMRAVTGFFDLPAAEVDILRGRGLPDDELPVVLFVARRAGVSAEALVALRRAGQSWGVLLGRYGVGADALHVPIPAEEDAGRLAEAYAQYRSSSPNAWSRISLSDADVIALVNVRLLAETLDLAPAEVLRRVGASGDFATRYLTFIR